MKHAATLLIGALAAIPMLATAPAAQATVIDADSSSDPAPIVLYSESTLVDGSAANVTTLDAPGAGELFLTLTDLDFPQPFASLSFSLSSSSTALTGMAAPGTLTLDLTQPTILYADVVAGAQTNPGVGLYNLTATFLGSSQAVPLPAGAMLLASGLLAAMLVGRARPFRRADRRDT